MWVEHESLLINLRNVTFMEADDNPTGHWLKIYYVGSESYWTIEFDSTEKRDKLLKKIIQSINKA